MESHADSVREAVAVFADEASLQAAIDDLLASGFGRADLSLLASEEAVNEKLGHKYKKASELEDVPGIPSADYVSPEALGDAEGAVIGTLTYIGAGMVMGPAAAVGASLTTIIGAAVIGGGVGAALGTVLAVVIGQQHAEHIQNQLDHGGLLLWVRAWDEDHEKRALDILARHSGQDVHVHQFEIPKRT